MPNPWDDSLAAAKAAGYDPAIEPAIRKDRDKLMSAKNAKDAEVASLKMQITTYQEAAAVATETANTMRTELETIRAEVKDLDASRAELETLRAERAAQDLIVAADLEALKAAWETAKPGSAAAIPAFQTPAEQLKWARDNAALFGLATDGTPAEPTDNEDQTVDININRQAPPTGQPTSTTTFSREVEIGARRAGIEPAAYQKLMQKLHKPKTQQE